VPAKLKILITSQKGGVGKSTVSANLAAYFAHVAGKLTTLIDLDHQSTAGKWVRNTAPIGIQCISLESPNNKGTGMALLQAKQALRSARSESEVIIADLTWTDILPAEFMFEFDLVLVPSSLSRVELDSTMEFVTRFDFVFNSKLRHPPKLIVVPSRVANMDTYKNIFYQSFTTAFFLSPRFASMIRPANFSGLNSLSRLRTRKPVKISFSLAVPSRKLVACRVMTNPRPRACINPR